MRFNLYPVLILIISISCVEPSTPKLSDHDWEVISINGTELSGMLPWINFDLEEGKVNGNAGCNNFFGGFEINNTHINFSPLGATRMMCSDMTNEDQFFQNIEKTTNYTFEKGLLTLSSNEKNIHFKLKPKANSN